jgi:cell division protein FtsL
MRPAVSAPARKVVSVKKGRAMAARWRFTLGVFLGLALIAVVLVHVWLRLQVVRMGYVLSTTSKLQARLEQENRELKLELATMTSPDRLEAAARRRLGLVVPEKGQVIVLP